MEAAVGIWVISGVTFWSAFVALGLRFRLADEADDAPATALDEPTPGRATNGAVPEHVLARSRR